ncbi:hypothetical protein BO70DRAFT_13539 [Aspergillus heteromorphus CBS 117.55]|uniref:Uncharacterized protein n=1 Tax=Aspergillus heteromorphus CBS 117.55 TaxID=1448321 RepID=A0A317X4M4_9EURO|nr:uncharacterized protein BO70DRAFT_13539 [Aspergillus heteromorphus CBS 117.55]PWY92552.1 hypothetical protein BO70DRAFT_13539 [Aspergillus heteromorphus CBS 117.55]
MAVPRASQRPRRMSRNIDSPVPTTLDCVLGLSTHAYPPPGQSIQSYTCLALDKLGSFFVPKDGGCVTRLPCLLGLSAPRMPDKRYCVDSHSPFVPPYARLDAGMKRSTHPPCRDQELLRFPLNSWMPSTRNRCANLVAVPIAVCGIFTVLLTVLNRPHRLLTGI